MRQLLSFSLGRQFGFINLKGDIVIPPRFSDAYEFSDGVAAVKDSQTLRWGYVNQLGEYVIEPQFLFAQPFCGLLAMAQLSEKHYYGLINRSGKWAVKLWKLGSVQLDAWEVDLYRDPFPMFDGVTVNGISTTRTGFAKLSPTLFGGVSAKWAIPPKFEGYHLFHSGLASVALGKMWGFIDNSGNTVIPFKWSWASSFFEGKATVGVPNERMSAVINQSGEFIFRPKAEFWKIGRFSGGLASVYYEYASRPETSCGYINTKGEIVVQPTFGFGGLFSEGLAPVKVKNTKKWGFINERGDFVIEPRFDLAMPFQNGVAAVYHGDIAREFKDTMRALPDLYSNNDWSLGYVDLKGNYIHAPTR